MEFQKSEWTGKWENFERYITSDDPYLTAVWEEAEQVCGENPMLAKMFAGGAKKFWAQSCVTVTPENPIRLGGWDIRESGEGIEITWLDDGDHRIGVYRYTADKIIEKGLEGKENFLLFAKEAEEGCPFRYVLAMEPMPERAARESGGLLSHLHFQFAASVKSLIAENRLCQPYWYATMCAGDSTILEKCNIVRALHRMPVWSKLPEI